MVLCLLFGVACKSDDLSSESGNSSDSYVLALNKTAMTLLVGEEEQLTTNYTGNNAIEWSVSDPNVASVENGCVQGLSVGKTIISANIDGQIAECSVTVKAFDETLLKLELDNSNIELDVGDEYVIDYTLTYNGENIEGATVSFSSLDLEDKNITISTDGKIIAKASGMTTCIVTIEYLGIEKNFSFTVSVKSLGSVQIEETAIELYAIKEFAGETYKNEQLLTVKAYEGGDVVEAPVLTWTIDDPSICEISENTVKGKHSGTTLAKVEYTTVDGIVVSDTVSVTVLLIERVINDEPVEIDKTLGYNIDKAELFGETDITFEKVFISDGKFETEVSLQDNLIVISDTSFCGESVLSFETGAVVYRLNICIWTQTLNNIDDLKVLLNSTAGWYKIGANIDLSGVEWKYLSDSIVFTGLLDGCGYALKGLSSGCGLFNALGNGSVVRNLNIEGAMLDESVVQLGVIASKTMTDANVLLEDITVDVCNNGVATGGLLGLVGAGSTIAMKDVTVHSYTSGGGTKQGSLFGAYGGNATFDGVKVYANTKLCSEELVSGNTGYQELNQADSVTILPKMYANELSLIAEEIIFENEVSNVNRVMVYVGASRVATFESGKIKLVENELLNLAGGTVEILFYMNDETVEYYVASVASALKLAQNNADYLFKVSNCDIVLTEDITLNGILGTPIAFTGTFDGQGHTISGIVARAKRIEYENGSVSYWYSGIWSEINGGTIKNTAFIIDQLGVCMGGIAYTATGVSVENVYIQVDSIAKGVEANYQGALFRQISLSEIQLKDVVVDICEYEGTRVGFVGMCSGGPLKLAEKNCHFIGGSGNIVAYSDTLSAGYLRNDDLITGANKYADRGAFETIKDGLNLSDQMIVWLKVKTSKDPAEREEIVDSFNQEWLL
jgi:hypothetical protein